MKTLLASALLLAFAVAIAIGGCSSNNPTTPTTTPPGSVAQGGACAKTVDCEPTLQCGYPLYVDGGSSCTATGICVAIGSCSMRTFCPCGGQNVAISACSDGVYAPQPVDTTATCTPDSGAPDSGVTPPVDSGTPPPVDSGTPPPVDSGTPHDSGTQDSGSVDSGPVDSGIGIDTGLLDSGLLDTGPG